MSKNIDQIFTTNPITSNASTDLMYFGQSPYGVTNDAAMTYAHFSAQFGAPFTPSGLTETNDTNVTLTLGGTPTTSLLQAVSITAGWSGTLSLARGGLAANLTASNGGIFYSTASAGAILAGTATAHQALLSGASTTPVWSTATYPTTSTVSQILYSSSANTIAGLATANNGTLVTSSSGVPSILAGPGTTGNVLQSNSAAAPSFSTATYPSTTTINQILYSSAGNVVGGLATTNSASLSTSAAGAPTWLALTTGQVVIGSGAGAPAAATLTASTGITITNGNNTITVAVNGADPWVDETGSTVTMTANTGYTSDDGATLVTLTLPTSSAIGNWVEINGKGAGLWKIAQAAGQQINFGSSPTTAGAGGSLASTLQYDSVKLRCITANTIWTVVAVQGNLTVV
jgi:trimeric autotransporter adhesin